MGREDGERRCRNYSRVKVFRHRVECQTQEGERQWAIGKEPSV